MIGSGKTQSIGVTVPPDYSVNLTPGSLFVQSSSGSSTSPTVYSSVVAGIGPFTYLWTITGDQVTINSPLEKDTSFSASGFNEPKGANAKLTVTDEGNGNQETSKTIRVDFDFS